MDVSQLYAYKNCKVIGLPFLAYLILKLWNFEGEEWMEGVNQAAVLKEDQGWLRTKCRKSLMIGAQRPEMLHNLKTQEKPLDSSKMSFYLIFLSLTQSPTILKNKGAYFLDIISIFAYKL